MLPPVKSSRCLESFRKITKAYHLHTCRWTANAFLQRASRCTLPENTLGSSDTRSRSWRSDARDRSKRARRRRLEIQACLQRSVKRRQGARVHCSFALHCAGTSGISSVISASFPQYRTTCLHFVNNVQCPFRISESEGLGFICAKAVAGNISCTERPPPPLSNHEFDMLLRCISSPLSTTN